MIYAAGAGWGLALPIKRELSSVVRGQTKITSPQPGDPHLQVLSILQKPECLAVAGHSASFIDVMEDVIAEMLHGLLEDPTTSPVHLLMWWAQRRSSARMGRSVGLLIGTKSMAPPTMARSPSAMESFLSRCVFLGLHSLPTV